MNRINPNHSSQRDLLRVVGPVILLIGGCFVAVGLISFFSAFGGHGAPKYFWCAFVGMPLSFVGLTICKFAYMGKVARYTAGELAPVGKDTFNYMAAETTEGVADVSEAFFEGKSRAEHSSIEDRIRKLEKMKNSGLINEEDFEEQKDRILSEL
ncbi:MAG: SHOCT domain-containing protein [Opitutaceae bacterium]